MATDDNEQARLANPQTVDPQGLVAFFGSMGWVANLPMRSGSQSLKP